VQLNFLSAASRVSSWRKHFGWRKSVVFSQKSGKFFRGTFSGVKQKNGFPHFARLPGAARRARALLLSANCLAPPRDRQRRESNPVDPCEHAAANIAHLYVLGRGGKHY